MSFKCGVVGLPNVGKSTLFNILSKSKVSAENFPFCTIHPNFSMVPVFDIRLYHLSKLVNSTKISYSFVEFVDIAGLVKGASIGEGLGNKFLNNIKNCTTLIHLLRCFNSDYITHFYGNIDPVRDLEIVNTELVLSDLEKCCNILNKFKNLPLHKQINIIDFKIREKLLQKCLNYLNSGTSLRLKKFHISEKKILEEYQFLTIKPMIFVLNLSQDESKNISLNKILNFVKKENSIAIPIKIDYFLHQKNFKIQNIKNFLEAKKYEKKFNEINKIVSNVFNLLGFQNFFTVGVKEIRSWSILKNITVREASRVIHTDFEKGFIRAKIISYSDFIKYKGEKNSKKFGKLRYEGKDYIVQDGDIINFLFNK